MPEAFHVPLTKDQEDCIFKLEELLKEVRKGNVHTIGIVACMRKGYAHLIGGTNAAELNLGLDSLKRQILDTVDHG